jgi:ABC-type uncharacterized transport system auxiliary subunit
MRTLILTAAMAAFLAGCQTTQSANQQVIWPESQVAGR